MPEFLIIKLPFLRAQLDIADKFNKNSAGDASAAHDIQLAQYWEQAHLGNFDVVSANSTKDVLDIVERAKKTHGLENVLFKHNGLIATSDYVIAGDDRRKLANTHENMKQEGSSETLEENGRWAWGFPRLFQVTPTKNTFKSKSLYRRDSLLGNAWAIGTRGGNDVVLLQELANMDIVQKSRIAVAMGKGSELFVMATPIVEKNPFDYSDTQKSYFEKMTWNINGAENVHLADPPINSAKRQLSLF